MARSKKEFDYKTIEFPMRGSTYSREEYGVYGYGRYERSSVLAGQQRRVFLDSFDTLEEAQKGSLNSTRPRWTTRWRNSRTRPGGKRPSSKKMTPRTLRKWCRCAILLV